ncbi:MAG TPA: alpha/beta hydrolase [Solirubrobacteraceae bacterium]
MTAAEKLRAAEARLFDACRLEVEYGTVALRDPAVTVAVRTAGEGPPLLFVHGSGMSAATWAPLLEHVPGHRLIAVDLPGFGLSDPYSYAGRPLREHAVAQLSSLLDAMGIPSVTVVGTSLGAMWALCLALDAPQRVDRVIALGVPAVCLPGMRGNAYFRLMTTPVLRGLGARAPAPKTVSKARRAMQDVFGKHLSETLGDPFYEVVLAAMAMPGWSTAMSTHLNLAMRRGRPRQENVFTDDELRRLGTPVRFVWGDADVYGPPRIGERAAALMPDARVDVIPGGHAPFLDDPETCAGMILERVALR